MTSHRIDDRVVDQRRNAFDAGDSYAALQGKRSLYRLAGAVALRAAESGNTKAILAGLTNAGNGLEGYQREAETRAGFVLLKADAASPDARLRNRAAQTQKLDRLRRAAGVAAANPVFIDPQSGLWLINTEEIIIALKPGTDARGYFGAEWDRVRPLFAPGGQFMLTLPSAESELVFAEVNRRASDPRVAWAEPNFWHQILPLLIPNDPRFNEQWYLRNIGQSGGVTNADINASAAWDYTTGSRSIVVAVLDIGFDLSHPDLISNIATNAGEIPGNGIDDDHNGYVDDVRGWDFYGNDNDPNPNTAYDNHGTAVAGAAIAAGNNGTGIAGVAYTSRLLPLRIGEASSPGSFAASDASIAGAIYYAAGGVNQGDSWRGADVIVMSFESFQNSAVDAALTFATEQGRGGRGCPVFAAMGNHGSGWQTYSLLGFPAGTYTFTWRYAKNASGMDGEDAVWLTDVLFPGGAVERFDGATFPPSGWTTSGDANWTRSTDPAHARGASLFTARSGVLGDNQSTTLQTTRSVGSGSLTWTAWISSEQNADIFSIAINGTVQTAYNFSGVPFIRAGPSYPGTHTNVITIGASTHFDTRADYSQIGGKIDLVAPGGGSGGALFLTTDRAGTAGDSTDPSPAGDYEAATGTSLANPVAAGVGALMLSVNSNLTTLQVRDILRGTADKIGPVPYTNGANIYYGYGRVNAQKAVFAALGAMNDGCSNAITITNPLGYTHTQSTVFVSSPLDQAISCGFLTGKDVWYKITLLSNGLLSVTTKGSDFDTVLSTYSGSCGSLTNLKCNDDVSPGTRWSTNGVLVSAGTYYIQAAGYQGASGTLVLNLDFSLAGIPAQAGSFSNATARSVDLRASVTPNNNALTAWFEYGLTSSFGSRTPPIASNDNQPFNMSSTILGLTPDSQYHFRIVTSNSTTAFYGLDSTFFTKPDNSVLDVTSTNDYVIGTSSNSPAGQTPPFAIDNTAATKYLNFDKLGAGLIITPAGKRNVRALTLISADDSPERDPTSFVLEGSDDGVSFTRIASNAVAVFPDRHFIVSLPIVAVNSYNQYRLTFPTVLNAASANSMQIAEIELLPYPEITSSNDTVSITLPAGAADVRGVARLLDRRLGDTNKLEIAPITGGNTIVDISLATGQAIAKGFELIGAADDVTYPERRPSNVTLAGSNDGANFTTLGSVSPVAPSANLQIQEFPLLGNNLAFARYRVTFGPPVGGNRIQVGELRLFGESLPLLANRANGTNVLVTWQDLAGFGLERKTNFSQAAWAPVTNSPLLSNGVNTVTLPISDVKSFFRLRKP